MRFGLAIAAMTVVYGTALAAPPPAVEFIAAQALLFGDAPPADCSDVACLIERAYTADAKAKALALALFKDTGDVAGVGPDEIMDGGYRGKIHLVPQLPVGGYRQHLAWVGGAMHDIDGFFTKLFADQTPPSYRWNALQFRFVRSIKKKTPSAYATNWTVEYNVEGSLLTSAAGVRETLFHELFHVNDEAHEEWSAKHLQADYDAIIKLCGATPALRCLAPFAPNVTMVRGGTFYAFQQNNGNGVHEYAAELAVRYFNEQSEMLSAKKLAHKAFKCGPAANARSWKALVDEFFAGRDLVPPCSS
jgi:hypothetical protein